MSAQGDESVSAQEIADLLRDLRSLDDTTPPAWRDQVMARKRAVIEQIEPGFYEGQS